jgi:Rho termination factor, N-terminal domain
MNTQYNNMTVAQLRKIATKYNIDRFLRKEELINAIIENDNIKAQQSEFVSIKFAFRTECENDVYDICHKCTENNLEVSKFSLTGDSPDCTVDGFTLCVAFDKEDNTSMIRTKAIEAIKKMIACFKSVPDCHVAVQSLDFESIYTGERNSELEKLLENPEKIHFELSC